MVQSWLMRGSDDPNRWRVREIRHALRLLSADPASQVQASVPPGLGVLADEFWSAFEHIDELKGSISFSPIVFTLLDQIDQLIRDIYEREDMWTEEALRSERAWSDIRALAASLASELPDEILSLEPPTRPVDQADLYLADEGGSFSLFIEDRLHTTIDVGTGERSTCLDLRAMVVAGTSSRTERWLASSSFVEALIAWLRARRPGNQPPIHDTTRHLFVEQRRRLLTVTIKDPTQNEAQLATEIAVGRRAKVEQATRLAQRLEQLTPSFGT